MTTNWNRTLWTMRILCPAMVVASVAVGYFAWLHGLTLTMAVDAFLAGFNVVLSWVQWRYFKLERK